MADKGTTLYGERGQVIGYRGSQAGPGSSKPIPSAAAQKKLDDEERAAFETETGLKYGLNSLNAFMKWKQKRTGTLKDLMGGTP